MTNELKTWIEQAKNGDQGAFASLLSRYTPMIETRLRRIRSPQISQQDIEDLRQEAYISFYRALTHYDMTQSEVDFGLYAKICVENGLTSALRKMKHLNTAPVLPLEALVDFQESERPDPSAQLIEKEQFEQLYVLVEAALSPYENKVWHRYMMGQSTSDIAAALGHSEKSINNAIYRIRRKLREELRSYETKKEGENH